MISPSADRIDVYSRNIDHLVVNETVAHYVWDAKNDDANLDGLPETIQSVAYCPGSINLRSFRSLKPADFRNDLEHSLWYAHNRETKNSLPGLNDGPFVDPGHDAGVNCLTVGGFSFADFSGGQPSVGWVLGQ